MHEDLCAIADGIDRINFMGALILYRKPGIKAGDISIFAIVDGQQRLTTCTIFASIVRNLINNYIKDLPSDDPFKRPLKKGSSE